MNTRRKQKFKIHTGRVSEIALFMVHFQDKAGKSMPCGYSKLVSQDARKDAKTTDELICENN